MELTFSYSAINSLQERDDLLDNQMFREIEMEREFTSSIINDVLQ